jgi:predicted pyridoxine 5'-phosphate oxidase superfamily flavin-nucleotide-binding protein
MPVLDDDMKRCVERQRLGFVASVSPDGTPNLSPKDTLAVWDEDTLVFADIRSPATVRNLIENPAVEVNVVDPESHRGFRFRGRARVLLSGPTFDRVRDFYRARGMHRPFEHVVFVGIEHAAAVQSPTA